MQRRSLDRIASLLPGPGLAAWIALAPSTAVAGPGDTAAARGLSAARKGDCVKAVPFLEDAELARHRPANAVVLADCYVALGELVKASELYHVILDDKPARFWVRPDYNARKSAQKKAADVDARIPTIRFDVDDTYEDLEVIVRGHAVTDLDAEKRVPPDVSVEIVARAKGFKEHKEKVVLNERERRVVKLSLDPIGPGKRKKTPPPPPSPPVWLGFGYRGVIIPRFVMNAFADGGRNLFVPGGVLGITVPASDVEMTISVAYMSYRMAETPFKSRGTPDTEWEIDSSDLQSLVASLDLLWTFPFDKNETVSFKIGGGIGVGWTFLGDFYRVQAYPANERPGDPYTYLPCKGPNNPKGSFRYCNTLDKDATHYPGYTEPSWFNHGVRPLIYPWLTLPELGLTFKPTKGFAIDVQTGVTLSGVLTGLNLRFAL